MSRMEPGFDLEQPAQLLPVTLPESVAAAQFGGFGKVGCPPTRSFPSALHSLLSCAVSVRTHPSLQMGVVAVG